jgi:hypothetical protein
VRVPSAGLSDLPERWRGGNWENLGDLGTVSGGFSAACSNKNSYRKLLVLLLQSHWQAFYGLPIIICTWRGKPRCLPIR